MTTDEAQGVSREREEVVLLSALDHLDALVALTQADWDEASAWAGATKRMQPGMTDDRWQGIRHGYAAGVASRATHTLDHAAAVAAGRAKGLEEAAKMVDAEAALRRLHFARAKAAKQSNEAHNFETMAIAHVQSAAAIRALVPISPQVDANMTMP